MTGGPEEVTLLSSSQNQGQLLFQPPLWKSQTSHAQKKKLLLFLQVMEKLPKGGTCVYIASMLDMLYINTNVPYVFKVCIPMLMR